MAYQGVKAVNEEQKGLFQLLDANKPIYAITGPAGTGKTLLTMAYGLHQVFSSKSRFEKKKLIYTRLQVNVGCDIGFLPGDEMEKSQQYFAPFHDNYVKLDMPRQPIGNIVEDDRIEMMTLQGIRGRTFDDSFIIVDEAQNLDYHTIATLATRIGKNTQMVFLGNFSQIDNEKVDTPETNGFYKMLEALYADGTKALPYFSHVNLTKVERSGVAAYMENLLRQEKVDARFYDMEKRGVFGNLEEEII